MTIRWYDKDHLQETLNSGELSHLVQPPILDDPLQFWSHHPKSNRLVDLNVFAEGLAECSNYRGQSGSFTGRTQLIYQLAPTIKAAMVGRSFSSIQNSMKSLRAWWRIFDEVEADTAQVNSEFWVRVEDVRHITAIHLDVARRSGVSGDKFTWFLSVVNATLKGLGARTLHWDPMERPKANRILPPDEQITALRVGLKQAWESIRNRFGLADRVRGENFVPRTKEEVDLLSHWQCFSKKQREFGVPLPTSEQLREGIHFRRSSLSQGYTLQGLRRVVFPDLWEADTAFHMCLANTGWNPAVLYDLDARLVQSFLRVHPYDNSRYILIGTKAKAGGKDQPVTGLWKTPWSPGPVIKFWLEKVEPLRQQLESMLLREKKKYDEMLREGARGIELVRQHCKMQRLEEGCRSVWLYTGRGGRIEWLRGSRANIHNLNNSRANYLAVLISKLNYMRVARGKAPIGNIRASDFRDIFALYVWRQSGGNVIALMRLLNHSRLRTTQDYVDNNILNAERDSQARSFLDHLFSELGKGRLDIALLAHLQRYGTVTKEMGQRLQEFRSLQRSRMGIACQDPLNPPSNMRSDVQASRWCTVQRCLLCSSNSVILPESLSGIAMRVEELIVIQKSVSSETWLTSDLPQELSNGLDALKLFPIDEVRKKRDHWGQEIFSGAHRIPGLRIIQE